MKARKRLHVEMPWAVYEQLLTRRSRTGESIQGFIKRAVIDALNKEGGGLALTAAGVAEQHRRLAGSIDNGGNHGQAD